MRGVALFKTMECLPILRVSKTGRSVFATPNVSFLSRNAWLTKVTELSVNERPYAPNIGRQYWGCGVGIDAFGSPMMAAAIVPLFSTISGLHRKRPDPRCR